MAGLNLTRKEEAKPAAAELLGGVERKFGFVPNLMAVFADSPSTLQAYLNLSEAFGKSIFTPEEQQAVLLAVSFENNCEYCMAAHSMGAVKMAGMPASTLNEIRSGSAVSNKKLDELVRFTKEIVSRRGNIGSDSLKRFFSAGFTNQHVLELILGIAMKTLSNYTNHIAQTPLDSPFSEFKWKKQ